MVEPLVVSPSGVDAIALGDNAAFEHNGVLVQNEGIGAGDVGRSLAFVRDPRFVGTGFFAGEAPDGLTTVYGDPISADVFVYWRDPDDHMAQEVLVGATKSAPDGTWLITGLNYNLRYVVRARASGRDDVTVVGVQPSRADVITYEGEFTNTEDFDGVAGEILITSGLPPFTATVIQPLPYGLLPVIDGRKLIIDGTSDDEGVWSSVVRVTAINGVFVDVPVHAVIGLKAPDITVRYAVAGDWTITLTLQLAGGSAFAEVLRVYRSTEPLDLEALPEHVAELDADAAQWVDADVEPGQTYYYAVGAYVGGAVAMSAAVEREAVWTPLDISAAVILDDDSSLSQTSGKVSSIVNRGVLGGSFSQSTDAYRPTIISAAANGKRALAFRSDEPASTGLLGDAAVRNLYRNAAVGWMFAVVRREAADTSATSRRVFVSYTPSNTARLGIYWDDSIAGAQNRIVAGGRRLDSDSYARVAGPTRPPGGWEIIGVHAKWSSRALALRLNGVTVASTTTAWPSEGSTSDTEGMGFHLCSRFVGDCVAAVAGAGAISDADWQRLEGWAAHRYGLTDNIPADHPYKEVAP